MYAYGVLGMQRKIVIGEEQFEEDLKRLAKLAVEMGAVAAKPIDVKNIFVAEPMNWITMTRLLKIFLLILRKDI